MLSTIDQIKLPLAARLLNRAGSILQRLRIQPISLSEASLTQAAQRQTGLSDWGGSEFRTGLRLLLRSLEEEANLSMIGRMKARQECIRLLSNRLRIAKDLKQHPEILEAPIHRPLFIVGLPRTGTTLLHNLLAQDPAARVPLLWELLEPSPPPSDATRPADPRIWRAEEQVRQLLALVPQIRSIHPFNPRGPEECLLLFQNAFESYYFSLSYDVPRYLDWLLEHDAHAAYRYYRQQLQLLQWKTPGRRWVLKTPAHLYALEALHAVFPDACLVQTHRDPLEVIPSFCSLVAALQQVATHGRVDLKGVGERCLEILAIAWERAMDVRRSASTMQFLDVRYHELMSDPVKVVQRIYARFGYDLAPQTEHRMRHWLQINPQNRRGVHRYSLEQFSLDARAVKQRFAGYYERFNIRPEEGRSSRSTPLFMQPP